MEHEKKVILLAGPTASGKSKLAIKKKLCIWQFIIQVIREPI